MNVPRILSSVAVLAALTLFLNAPASANAAGTVEACDCWGGVTVLTLQYNGPNYTTITVDQPTILQSGKSSSKSSKSSKSVGIGSVYVGTVEDGDEFTLVGTMRGNRLGRKITIWADGVSTTIYTNCSQAIGVGTVFGPFTVVAGVSRRGGQFCQPPPPAVPLARKFHR